MGNQKRKLWGRGDHDATVEQSQPSSDEAQVPAEENLPEEPTSSLKQRIDEYDTPAGVPEAAHDERTRDLDGVGAEVSTVLRSAQEAATRIRGQARADAAKIREEAKAAAAVELEETRRVHAEAQAEAERIRSEAAAHAQQVRTDAEREAAQANEEARLRFERADQEVEERLRKAEEAAREQRDSLEAETHRYHERLEKMLGVFQGMSSQLEELLGAPPAAREGAPEETLEDALQPSSGSERAA